MTKFRVGVVTILEVDAVAADFENLVPDPIRREDR